MLDRLARMSQAPIAREPPYGVPAVVPNAPLSYREACALIEGRGQGIRPDLSRIRALLDLLDHPERACPTVHLAGTNGKTSTARLTGALLAAEGLTTGIYTSPHLQSLRERYALAGPGPDHATLPVVDLIPPEELAETLEYLLPFVALVEADRPERVTYFELTTALAFEWMAGHSVSAAVVEAGMGGSWDATNVVAGEVAVLTRIGVDHAAFLGTTPLDNAREKVGIIKPGARVVSAAQEPEVALLIRQTADAVGAHVRFLDEDFRLSANESAIGGRLVSVEGPQGGRYDDLFVPLLGAYQGINAALALAAAEELLGRPLDRESAEAGLSVVTSPGRLEVVSRDPLTVLDGAHNPQAAALLGPALAAAFMGSPRVFVLSIFSDKDIPGILAGIAPAADILVVTASGSERSAPPEVLASQALAAGFPARAIHRAEHLPEAVQLGRELAGGTGLVVVTGSLYAVGEARDALVGPLV